MKFIIEVGIEVACIKSTAYENFNIYTIMDFSALVVLNYIDMYYAMALTDELKGRISVMEN